MCPRRRSRGHAGGAAQAHEHSHDVEHSCGQHHQHHAQDGDEADLETQERRHFTDVLGAFLGYETEMLAVLSRWEQQQTTLPSDMQAMLPHRREKIMRLKQAVSTNAGVLREIAAPHISDENIDPRQNRVSSWNFEKMRSTVKQFVREWSAEGKPERDACMKPLLDELQRLVPVDGNTPISARPAVVVPGAGLGRLVFDVARAGYRTQGNEFSYFMLLASDFILNRVASSECVTLHPFIHSSCNVFDTEQALRAIHVPDADMTAPESWDMSMVAGEFLEVYGQHTDQWDAVLSCFFLDTAHNVIDYLRTIYRMLKPGGYLINIGPLLWHYEGMPGESSLELSFDEVRHVLKCVGFVLEKEQRTRTPYTDDPRSMMHVVYDCVLFVCRKPLAPGEPTSAAAAASVAPVPPSEAMNSPGPPPAGAADPSGGSGGALRREFPKPLAGTG